MRVCHVSVASNPPQHNVALSRRRVRAKRAEKCLQGKHKRCRAAHDDDESHANARTMQQRVGDRAAIHTHTTSHLTPTNEGKQRRTTPHVRSAVPNSTHTVALLKNARRAGVRVIP
jgi:hypothetical protein